MSEVYSVYEKKKEAWNFRVVQSKIEVTFN